MITFALKNTIQIGSIGWTVRKAVRIVQMRYDRSDGNTGNGEKGKNVRVT